jgi:hypothetical protein
LGVGIFGERERESEGIRGKKDAGIFEGGFY